MASEGPSWSFLRGVDHLQMPFVNGSPTPSMYKKLLLRSMKTEYPCNDRKMGEIAPNIRVLVIYSDEIPTLNCSAQSAIERCCLSQPGGGLPLIQSK